ncbi:hypothetical protein [Methylobacterium nodulans]|uniref:Uncharacterized protein n=1 Tax=Methylobacterium nodulans (strain LMG 21967 / CNCM I-2342 / ORS 2060) TaxID=460265 RepID=B8IXV1_METNO|nr:hypothetical protein [Methylobacterium nodulans]ACL63241.1 hypothetical protein Mnod_8780 [Methylobacterium nodulans ORS 2060]
MKKPAHRGATAGLSIALRQDSIETYAPHEAPRQAKYLSVRYGLSPLHAALIAELAYPAVDTWRGGA